MRNALAVACCLALSAFAAAPPWKVPPAELKGVANPVAKAERAASAARGADLYKVHCSSCHGDLGKGDGPDGLYFIPPPGNLAGSKQSDAELFVKISVGRGNMVAFAEKLDVAQRWDVVNHLKTLK